MLLVSFCNILLAYCSKLCYGSTTRERGPPYSVLLVLQMGVWSTSDNIVLGPSWESCGKTVLQTEKSWTEPVQQVLKQWCRRIICTGLVMVSTYMKAFIFPNRLFMDNCAQGRSTRADLESSTKTTKDPSLLGRHQAKRTDGELWPRRQPPASGTTKCSTFS